MRELGIDRAVFTDESSIAYLAGFWGYLGIEFGRPSMLIVDAHDAPTVITPLMESEMVTAMTSANGKISVKTAGHAPYNPY